MGRGYARGNRQRTPLEASLRGGTYDGVGRRSPLHCVECFEQEFMCTQRSGSLQSAGCSRARVSPTRTMAVADRSPNRRRLLLAVVCWSTLWWSASASASTDPTGVETGESSDRHGRRFSGFVSALDFQFPIHSIIRVFPKEKAVYWSRNLELIWLFSICSVRGLIKYVWIPMQRVVDWSEPDCRGLFIFLLSKESSAETEVFVYLFFCQRANGEKSVPMPHLSSSSLARHKEKRQSTIAWPIRHIQWRLIASLASRQSLFGTLLLFASFIISVKLGKTRYSSVIPIKTKSCPVKLGKTLLDLRKCCYCVTKHWIF